MLSSRNGNPHETAGKQKKHFRPPGAGPGKPEVFLSSIISPYQHLPCGLLSPQAEAVGDHEVFLNQCGNQ